jgi:hypothetical protein
VQHEFFDLLRALVGRGYAFQHLRDQGGELIVIVGSYGWGTHCDRLHVWSEREAVAARELVDGRPWREGVVWSCEGSAADTTRALLELPPPGRPGAPNPARGAPSGLWLPPGVAAQHPSPGIR